MRHCGRHSPSTCPINFPESNSIPFVHETTGTPSAKSSAANCPATPRSDFEGTATTNSDAPRKSPISEVARTFAGSAMPGR